MFKTRLRIVFTVSSFINGVERNAAYLSLQELLKKKVKIL